MKITDNLLHNQNYMFSEQLYQEKLKSISKISKKIKPSGFKTAIVLILSFIISPGIAITITSGHSDLLGPLLWGFLILVIMGCNYCYEYSSAVLARRENLKKYKEKLESVMWQHTGYTIYGKPPSWGEYDI